MVEGVLGVVPKGGLMSQIVGLLRFGGCCRDRAFAPDFGSGAACSCKGALVNDARL